MKLDKAQLLLDEQPISIDVLLEKYAKGDEQTVDEVRRRVARGLAQVEKPELRQTWEQRFYEAMVDGFIPGGRVNSAARRGLNSTPACKSRRTCMVGPRAGDSQGNVTATAGSLRNHKTTEPNCISASNSGDGAVCQRK